MEFKELLAAFAAKYGIEGLDGADGAAELEVDGIRVELLNDYQNHSILACVEIGRPQHGANDAFCSMMLQANFLLRATEGATLCQNPETHAYAIVRPFPLPLMAPETLAAGIESLVNQAENWHKVLTGLHVAETEHLKVPQTGDSHHEMLSNGFFHV